MKPHPLLNCIRPDEVAECWEGVGDDLYKALWRVAEEMPSLRQFESPPEPDLLSVAKYWRKFSQAEQEKLNALAKVRDDEISSLDNDEGWE